MWTEITRPKYDRDELRYASDMRDAEWALIEPLLPAKRALGRPRTTSLREVVNALLYLLRCSCPWRLLPQGFPPRSTVQGYFYAWRSNGVWQEINQALLKQDRLAEGRNAAPSAGVIDSQSAKTTESGGPRGGACPRAGLWPDPWDAGKKVKGRKRHIMTDTDGRLLTAVVHSAAVQRTAMERRLSSRRCASSSRSLSTSSPTAPTEAQNSPKRSSCTANGPSKSSSAPTTLPASKSCPGDGLSSAPSLGSIEIDDWQKTSKPRSPAQKPGSSWPALNSSCADWQGLD